MTLHLLVSLLLSGSLLLTFEIEGHMTFYLFGVLARRGALSHLLTEVALGSAGYDDGAGSWHFILIVSFIMRDALSGRTLSGFQLFLST